MTSQMTARHFRTLFISDVHLGSKAAQAELLVDFLRVHDAETIYLVGDIVDGWRLKLASVGNLGSGDFSNLTSTASRLF